MAQTKIERRVRPTRDYIKTTKGGTRVVRTIDVLRSEGGRKAIGTLLEGTNYPDAPPSNGAPASNSGAGSATGYARAATVDSSDEAEASAEALAQRASYASK